MELGSATPSGQAAWLSAPPNHSAAQPLDRSAAGRDPSAVMVRTAAGRMGHEGLAARSPYRFWLVIEGRHRAGTDIKD